MSEYKTGDRVRVSFEEVPHEGNFSIEKVEPPVVTFKPGDVVRSKIEGSLWQITNEGYLRLGGDYLFQESGVKFTSKHYEKVEL